MKTKILSLLLLGVLVTSCSVARLQTDDAVIIYPPAYSENVEVYATDQFDKTYTVIGEVIVSAEDLSDASVPVKYLKKEAAKLGADGIINLRLEIGHAYFCNSIVATGTAVKFTK